MTMPTGYIGGPQPTMSVSEAQVVGQTPMQPMLPGLMVAAPMAGVMPGLTPAFTESRAADEHSEHMVRNLLIGFDVFERYFQQMEKHSTMMAANTDALTQHTRVLLDLEKQLTDVRKAGVEHASQAEAAAARTHQKVKDTVDALGTTVPDVAAAPGRRRTSGQDTPPRGAPPSPEPPAPTNIVDDYRAGGLPRVVSARLERHYATRLKALGGDRLNELEGMGAEGRASAGVEDEYQGLLSRTSRARSGVRVAQNVEEKGAIGALGGEFPMVARFAGVAGAAVAAYEGVQKIGQMVSGQREAAAQYQQGIGGSEAGGLYQGARERLFGFRNMFGMGDAQARQLYQGVTAMGIDDAQGRQSALDFATSAFRDTGLQVAQSLEIIRTAASAGVTDFSQLGDAITQVSKAARVGGISVAQATQMFTQNMQGVQGALGGQTAIPVATAITTGLAQLGPEIANNVNLTGLYTSPTEQFRMASQLGLTHSQLLAHEAANPNFAMNVGQRGIDQLADAVLGGPGRAWVARAVQAQIKAGASEQNAARQVAIQAMNANVLNIDRASVLAPSYGVQVNDQMALAIMIVQSGAAGLNIGAGSMTSAAQTTVRPGAPKGSTLLTASAADRATVSEANGSRGNYVGLDMTTATAHDRLLHNLTVQQGQISQKLGYGTSNPFANTDVSHYQELVERFGKRDPVIEALLKKGVYDHNTRFEVQTANGARDVSLGIAMHHYLDQLARGDVQIVGGEHKGMTVGQLLAQQGVQVDPNATGANMDPNSAKDSATQAAIKSSYSKTPKGGGGSGTVIIRPSADLQRILNFYPSGGAYIEYGRQSGLPGPATPPVNDYPTSGNGY